MELRDELRALEVAVRRLHEELLAEIRGLREEQMRRERGRLLERALLFLALLVGLVGWWRP
jgi:hypothetical protein